ncbi:Ran-specific GTPase-activating protein 30 [Cladophialophora chaetospira]|uniref:Ran-specific GTPase-activating protein 30 n=1 Tax=Cladophialophora chaetospira TaxID=386627 RepID=A0AA38X5E0_9EURO|nr:Ran-specific GTPase-activating protein 30 [Cladophialophora chaetospira]
MDLLLGKVTQQAMNYAIRSGVTITASFAIRQSARLLNNTPKSNVRDEFDRLRRKLEHKVHIVSPAIDLIELIAARGNTSLESAVALVKELRLEIQILGQRLAKAVEASEQISRKTGKWSTQARAQSEAELTFINRDIRALLDRIEDAVPLINLAITTSGASLSTQLPQTVSPSRLLQASTFLTAGDTQYSMSTSHAVQIGPTFVLTVYMLFAGHNRPQDEEELRETTWKEVIHKARVKLRRVPLDAVVGTGDAIPGADISSPVKLPTSNTDTAPSFRASSRSDEYAYQLLLVEDFDDDRVHDFSDTPVSSQPGPFDDVVLAGIRETIPVHEISKIFYANTSKVLNIGSDAESNHPVLLLKRDLNAVPPRRMVERDEVTGGEDDGDRLGLVVQDEQHQQQSVVDETTHHNDPWRFPPSLDPEWIAFEVYSESEPSDSDSEAEDSTLESNNESPSQLASQLSSIHLQSPSPSPSDMPQPQNTPPPWTNKILTSLSLLELLLRLTSLQQFQQQSHLSITDELLTFFLEESASTGAGGDERYRQQLRQDARRRVGWDPYDESPVKRRGEEYQYGGYQEESPGMGSLNGSVNGGWSPMSPRVKNGNVSARGKENMQRQRGMMSPSPTPSPLPSPVVTPGKAGRAGWLRREGDGNRKGSPLRPQTALTDEGIGTSPASGGEKP